MEKWLAVAIFAQFLFAISTLIDKHIVARAAHIGKPIVYAFYVALLSGFVIVLVPFGVTWTTWIVLLASLLNAASFVFAIYCMYSALSIARASDVSPVVGAISAVTTVVLAALFIAGDVTQSLFFPLVLLVGGTALISHFHFTRTAIIWTMFAGLFFGITAYLGKVIFLQTTFIDGFFWPRMMNLVVALALLVHPTLRAAILHGGRQSSSGAKTMVVGNKILAGVAAALTAYAISIGSVSTVNALAGLQFVFLFMLSLLFARHMPLLGTQKTGNHGGWRSFVGLACIVAGLAWLYFV